MGYEKNKQQYGKKNYVNKRFIEKGERGPPKIYGKNVRDIDLTKIKKVNIEAIKRSHFDNMLVEKLSFYDSLGRYCIINSGLLKFYTLTPSKPLIDCNFIDMEITKGAQDEKTDDYKCNTRLCMLDPNKPVLCRPSKERIDKEECFAKKSYLSGHEFWVVLNGSIKIGDNDQKNFKIGFFNLNMPNGYDHEDFIVNPNKQKAECLRILYEKLNAGIISTKGSVKPGTIVFHTVFSGDVDIDILSIKGREIKGIVKGYNHPPGGVPRLFTWPPTATKHSPVPLYLIESMLINGYKIDDVRNTALALMMNGHLIGIHGTDIIDYCKASVKGRDQIISRDGRVIPRDPLDTHDMEIDKIIRETRSSCTIQQSQ